MKLSVDGAICHALVDSGCLHCIVHAPYCASWTRKRADVMTMSGERQRCEGVGRVQLRVCNGDSVVVDVYVVDFKPLGFEFILGVNGISALGGVTISPSLAMHFGSADEKPICAVATQVEKIVGAGVTQVEKIVGAGVTQVEKIVGAGVTQAEKTVGTGVTQVKKTIGAGPIEIDETISSIHEETGHHGIKRTLYFSRKVSPAVTRRDVRRVVIACQVCQSIDPAPVKWARGQLNVDETWHRVGMDVTHVNGCHYLTLIDCGPSRFAVCRRLRRQDTASVIQQLELVFFERGAPAELLTDNDTAFRSAAFKRFAERGGMRVRFRCAYVASGNAIAERCHRSVKRIATRKHCTIAEAVYWYNVAPKDDVDSATAPANVLYDYKVRLLGIDRALPSEPGAIDSPYDVGDAVWVKPAENRCHTKYELGTVTGVVSEQTMEVDGMPRHVRDLRSAVPPEPAATTAQIFISDDEELPLLPARRGSEEDSSDSEEDVDRPLPRRSGREKRFPDRYGL